MDVLLLEENGGRALLAERLAQAGCCVRARVEDPDALEEAARAHADALLVVDVARPEHALLEQVAALARRRDRPLAVFVEHTDAESIRRAVRAGISSYVVRGAHADRLRDALEVARARFLEERALRSELHTAKTSLAHRKIIERAKGRLMQQKGLDEQSAYAAMRSLAMRRQRRLVDVARAVLASGPR